MIQVAFDLVVIGALIAVATSRFQVVPRRTMIRPEKPTPNMSGHPRPPTTKSSGRPVPGGDEWPGKSG